MDIIVETGAIVADANSYVSVADFIEFCSGRGFTITEDNAKKHLLISSDYMATYGGKYKGARVSATQEMDFPRIGAVIDRVVLPSNVVPQNAIRAQMYAALVSSQGTDLLPIKQNGKQLIVKGVGPIRKEWAYDKSASINPQIPNVIAYLEPLLNNSGGMAGGITTDRA